MAGGPPAGKVDTQRQPRLAPPAPRGGGNLGRTPKLGRSQRRPLRVAFFSEIGSGNVGNDGSFEVGLDWVRGADPDAEIFAICREPERIEACHGIPAKFMLSPGTNTASSAMGRFLWRVGHKARDLVWMFRLLRDTDWVIVAGSGALESSWARPWALPYALYGLTLAARLRGTRIALINVGADRSPNRWTRWLISRVARSADYLTLRDYGSAASLRSMGVEASPNQVYADLAFTLPAPAEQPPRPRCIGVGVISYLEWRGSPAEVAAKRAAYLQVMISLLEWLLDEGYSVRLLTGDRQDDAYLSKILETVRSRRPDLGADRLVGEPVENLHELMDQMRDVEVVIGARYHNVIGALRLAKPTLALSYAFKHDDAQERFGLSAFTQPVTSIDLTRFKDQFAELYCRRAEIGDEMRIRLVEIETQLQAQRDEFCSQFLVSSPPPRSSRRLPWRITPYVG